MRTTILNSNVSYGASAWHLTVLVVFVSVGTIASNAKAGGLEFPDLGTVAIGRGGAFTARADNLSAFHYNPAGLAKASGINLLLSANLVHLKLDYTRAGSGGYWIDEVGSEWVADCPDGEICISDPAEDYSSGAAESYKKTSTSGIGPMPMLVFTWGDIGGVEGLAISAGLLPPSSFGAPSFSKTGAQRYALIKAHHLMAFPGIGISYEFNRYFQIGGVFLSGIALLNQSLAIRPAPVLGDTVYFNEDHGGDAILELKAKDMFVPTGIFGVMSQPLDWLEIGVALKLPAKVDADGELKYKEPKTDMVDSKLAKGRDKVALQQEFPLMIRVGARYIHKVFDVEVDFVWENWSSMEGFDIQMDAAVYDGLNSTTEMPDVMLAKNFRDTYSVRLGGDVEVWPKHIALRLGGFYQSSAYPENFNTFSVDFPFAEQIGLGGGITWHAAKWLDVNGGYMHIFQPDVVVKKGIVQQQGLPLSTGEEIGNVINGGKYEVAISIFGVSLEGHF